MSVRGRATVVVGDEDDYDDPADYLEPEEQTCHRCRGIGEDADGADCVFCEGYGSIVTLFPGRR